MKRILSTKAPLKYKFLYDQESLTKEDLDVKGYLNLGNTSIASLPDNLKVGVTLNLANTNIANLPDNLKVGGDLLLHNTNIVSLPRDLEVEHDLFLKDTPLSKKYTRGQIRKMVPGVKGNIYHL